jgi:DNA-binding LacI/PurR family transcriptional regulator
MADTRARGARSRGPTIADVARLAGVSAQTVSRTATGAEYVSPETRDRVLHAMDQLGYSPNRAARALRNGHYGTIGLLAHDFHRTGEALTTDAVLRAARDEDYTVTLLTVPTADTGDWTPAAARLQHQTVDGLIIIRAEGGSADLIALPPRFPVAVSDSRVAGLYPCVVSDEAASMRGAVEHLLALGHATVHHVAGPADSEPARLRTVGWQGALERAGIPAPKPIIGDWTVESGHRAGQILVNDPAVTAVVCANDEMAFGLMAAMQAAGRVVPDDVSVVGFDDIALSRFANPSLTTVRQDFNRMGAELVRLVLDQVRGQSPDTTPHIVVPTELVLRGSTAPPRA